MRRIAVWLLFSLALAAKTTTGLATGPPQQATGNLEMQQPWPGFRGDLGDLLERVAQSYRLPMLIVLAEQPPQVNIPAGNVSVSTILNTATGQAPEYTWELRESAVYFYHPALAKHENYPFSWRIGQFRIPSTVADLNLLLRSELDRLQQRVQGSGNLIIGIRSEELAKHTLEPTVVHNLTAADIMLRALSMDRAFYCVIKFPNSHPNRTGDLDVAYINWRWVPLKPPAGSGVGPGL